MPGGAIKLVQSSQATVGATATEYVYLVVQRRQLVEGARYRWRASSGGLRPGAGAHIEEPQIIQQPLPHVQPRPTAKDDKLAVGDALRMSHPRHRFGARDRRSNHLPVGASICDIQSVHLAIDGMPRGLLSAKEQTSPPKC